IGSASDLIGSARDLFGSARDLTGSAPDLIGSGRDLTESARDLTGSFPDLIESACDLTRSPCAAPRTVTEKTDSSFCCRAMLRTFETPQAVQAKGGRHDEARSGSFLDDGSGGSGAGI